MYDARFTDNIFGMFVHWGFYSQLGIQEQVFARADMDRNEYEKYMFSFNPVEYNPEKWVLLAKEAGMKYICFTAKHHDGFCMFDTKYTDYSIMHTPYGKDVLKELSLACQKHGMMLSIYYSIPDWHHENGYNRHSSHQWKAKQTENNDYSLYIEYIKNQITELLTNYGRIYTLFWDIPPHINYPEMNKLVRRLQPDIYINNRGFDEGDFSTPERELQAVSAGKRFTQMTEACNALGEQSWGYRINEDYHTFRYLTHSIDKIMALGGSYLLNVGPDSLGNIPPIQQAMLKKIGSWYNSVSKALECSQEDNSQIAVQNTKAVFTAKDNSTFIHLFDGISSSALCIYGYKKMPYEVILLNKNISLPFEEAMMPTFMDFESGIGKVYLHISGIPANELESEAIVIEIKWQKG